MTPLLELAERVEGLEGADREVDYLVAEAMSPFIAEHGYHRTATGWATDTPPFEGASMMSGPSAYTASTDAVLALIAEKLPGWHWSLYDTDGTGKPCAQVEPPEHSFTPIDGVAKTPALALLSACLRAIATNTEGNKGLMASRTSSPPADAASRPFGTTLVSGEEHQWIASRRHSRPPQSGCGAVARTDTTDQFSQRSRP